MPNNTNPDRGGRGSLHIALTTEALAEAIWNARELEDPSGEDYGCVEGQSDREPVWWNEAVDQDLWPGSRRDTLREAEIVIANLQDGKTLVNDA